MRSVFSMLAVSLMIAVAPLAASHAEWTGKGKQEFFGSCMTSCQNGDASQAGRCNNYCLCMGRGLEAAFPDEKQVEALQQSQDPSLPRTAQALAQACQAAR